MKILWFLLHRIISVAALGQAEPAAGSLPKATVLALTLGCERVTIVHLLPGYVSSIGLPEEVSSVVLGDPKSF